jgi:hypothetical protein
MEDQIMDMVVISTMEMITGGMVDTGMGIMEMIIGEMAVTKMERRIREMEMMVIRIREIMEMVIRIREMIMMVMEEVIIMIAVPVLKIVINV